MCSRSQAAARVGLHLCWCFQGWGASCVPSEAAGIPSDAASMLSAGCACGASPCRLVPRWLGAGRGGQGRAGAVVGTGPTPGPQYKYLGLPAAVFTWPQPGGGSSRAGLGGGGDQATAQSLPSGQTGRSLPAPFLGGGEVVTPNSGLPGATSEALTPTPPLGFPGSGRETSRDGTRAVGQETAERGVGKNEGEDEAGGGGL